MCYFKSSSHPLRTSSVSGIAQHRTYKLKFKIQTLQSAAKGNPWILSWWGIHSSFVQSKSFWGRSRHRELAEFWCWIVEPSHFPWPGCSEVVQHCLDTLGMSGTAQPSWIKAQGMGISPGTKNCSEMQERGIWAREISTLTFGTGIYSWNKEQQHHCNNGLIAAYLFFFFLVILTQTWKIEYKLSLFRHKLSVWSSGVAVLAREALLGGKCAYGVGFPGGRSEMCLSELLQDWFVTLRALTPRSQHCRSHLLQGAPSLLYCDFPWCDIQLNWNFTAPSYFF